MKLYTEEQVNKALELLIETGKHNSKIIEQLTPIELPSDEEIDKKGSEYVENKWEYVQIECYESFTDGAKWLKDKILNQNK